MQGPGNRLVLMMRTASGAPTLEPCHPPAAESRDGRPALALLGRLPVGRSRSVLPGSSSGRSIAQVAEAKAVCAGCRVRYECLAFALRTHQAHGIWGGLTEQERFPLRSATLAGVERGQAAQVDTVHAADLGDYHEHA